MCLKKYMLIAKVIIPITNRKVIIRIAEVLPIPTRSSDIQIYN